MLQIRSWKYDCHLKYYQLMCYGDLDVHQHINHVTNDVFCFSTFPPEAMVESCGRMLGRGPNSSRFLRQCCNSLVQYKV